MLILLRQKRDKTEQWHQFTMELKNCIFFYSFFPSIPWLSRDIPGQEGTTCQNLVLARPMAKCQNPSRSTPWQDFELVPLSLCTETMKSFLSLCPAASRTRKFVPLETLVQMQLQKGLGKLVGVPVQFVYGRVDVVLCVRQKKIQQLGFYECKYQYEDEHHDGSQNGLKSFLKEHFFSNINMEKIVYSSGPKCILMVPKHLVPHNWSTIDWSPWTNGPHGKMVSNQFGPLDKWSLVYSVCPWGLSGSGNTGT